MSDGPRIIIIADDLTGANDTGVQIAKRGIETVTLVDPGSIADYPVPGVVVDTESRVVSVERSRKAVETAALAVRPFRDAIVYKKVDSTLRGHLGAELDVLVRALEPELVVCAPAYPKNGRTTRDGIHMLRGVPVDRTELARDPKNPIDTASLPALLAKEGGPRFRHVALDVLRAGGAGEMLSGERFLSFDCEEQEDLVRIVDAVRTAGKRTLWCGSAGLAEVLLEMSFPDSASSGTPHAPAGTSSGTPGGSGPAVSPAAARASVEGLPVFSVVGSMSAVSLRQFEAALVAAEARTVRLDIASLLASQTNERRRLVAELEREAPRGGHLILSSLDAAHEPRSQGQLPEFQISREELSSRVAECLGSASAEFLERNRVAGMFLTGGDTAIHVILALGVRGMRIERELEPGIPAVRFIGGTLDGLPAVTKAGAFGDDGTLIRAAAWLASAAV